MGEDIMRTHHRPKLDDKRSQLKSGPASLHSDCQDFHSLPLGDFKENARTSRSIIGISKISSLRPKLHALKAIKDASSRPNDWHDLPIRNPGELPKPDILLRGSMSARGPLYPLSCNSQTNSQLQTPRVPRVPSKLDALRKQMASAPGARIGPGNLHSFCYDYLYQREGSYKPPKLDEKALRLIDEKLEAADTLGSCYFGQGILRPRARYSRSAQEPPSTCKREIGSRMHRRRGSSTGDMMSVAAGQGSQFASGRQSRDVLEEFHPKNYRLRSDMDTLRRRQRSAPSSTVNMESCSCQCDSERTQKPSKKSVNFKEPKEQLKSRYEFYGQEVPVPFTAKTNITTSLRPAAKADHEGRARDRECTSARHCYTRRCKPSRKCDEEITCKSRSNGTAAAAPAPAPVHASAVGQGCSTSSQSEMRFREESMLYSGDLLALSEDLEASQVKDERLDKSLQRQKMMLRLIRRSKQKSCSYIDLQASPGPRPPFDTHALLQR